MALIEYLRPLIFAGGFLFIMVGLSILIAEQPSYLDELTGLYTLVLYTFYLYLMLLFLSLIVAVLDTFLKLRQGKRR